MSTRRYRHFNPAQVLHARGAWDARRTGLADGRMASWPSLPCSAMAGPTQVAADNTRPVLVSGVRAYVQFQASESRRLHWYGAAELDTFRNVDTGIIVTAYQAGTLTGGTEFIVQFTNATGLTRAGVLAAFPTGGAGYASGGRRLDAGTFASALVGTATANQSVVHSGRFDFGSGSMETVVQNGNRLSATATFSSGSGLTSNTASSGGVLGADVAGVSQTNARVHAFAILRPPSPIADASPVLRRITQSFCVSFGIPYRS